MSWNGEERREKATIRELVARIDATLSNLDKRFTAHELEDKQNFEKHSKRIWLVERWMLVSIGGFAVAKWVFHLF